MGRASAADWPLLRGVVRWGRALVLAVRNIFEHDGTLIAGYMAFMGLLALFPFLVFLATLAGQFGGRDAPVIVVSIMFDHLPAQVVTTLGPAVQDVLGGKLPGLLTLSVIGVLWVAANGVEAMRRALNAAYGSAKPRPLWYRRLQATLLVIGVAATVVVLSVSVIFTPLAVQLVNEIADASHTVARWLGPEFQLDVPGIWHAGRVAGSGLAVLALLALVHWWLPNRRHRLRDVLPGVVLTMLGWLATSHGFAVYLASVPSYSLTYGTLGGVIVTLLFFYAMALIFVYGAEFNAALAELSGREFEEKWHPRFRFHRPRLRRHKQAAE